MKNKLVTHFHLKEVRTKDGNPSKHPIYLRITLNGQRSELSTQQKIEKDLWDKSAERVKGRSEQTRTINAQLSNLENKVNKLFLRIDSNDKRFSMKILLNELHGKTGSKITLVKAYENLISTMEKTVNIDYTAKTIQRYKSSKNSLVDYMTAKYGDGEISLSDLDHEFIRDFEIFLKTTKKLQHNSYTKDIKNIKRVINYSIENNWIKVDPFKGFTCSYRNNNRDILIQEEIDQIYSEDLSNTRLKRIRNVFVFQIYTGLSYGDLYALTPDDVHVGIDGDKWITIYRQKTAGRSSIPLLPRAEEIVNNYADDALCLRKNKLLPVTSNQKMNEYLKEISNICSINKKITTHTARHTFATTITLTNGVPIESVSKMLGHKSLKTTQIYSKVVDLKVAEDMKKLKGIMKPDLTNPDKKSNQ